MAESLCRENFEAEVVAGLCPHVRPDDKPTLTERARLTSASTQTWTLLGKLHENRESVKDEHENILLKDMFRIWEVAVFPYNNVLEAQRRQMASLLGIETIYYDARCKAELIEAIRLCNGWLENPPRASTPDKSPLGFFAMFDYW